MSYDKDDQDTLADLHFQHLEELLEELRELEMLAVETNDKITAIKKEIDKYQKK